jgi:hypothetical protein
MPIPELQEFRSLLAAKATVKTKVMHAMGEARLARLKGEDDAPFNAVIEEYGIRGKEGELMAQAQALADKVVTEHPELFVNLEAYADEDRQKDLIKMASVFKRGGFEDERTLVTIFELARFERQNIGGRVKAQLRLPGKVGV